MYVLGLLSGAERKNSWTIAEQAAGEHARTTLRRDTRSDLVEARGLYARLGYQEVPAFNADPYAEHWFEKSLT